MSDVPEGPGWWLASDGRYYPPEPMPSNPTPAVGRRDQVPAWLAIGGAGVVVIGAFLPWATVTAPFVGTISKAGTSGDGVLTLLLGVAAGGFGVAMYRGSGRRGFAITALVLTSIALVIGLYDMVDISHAMEDVPDDVPVAASAGAGLWLTVLGAGASLAGWILWLRVLRPASGAVSF